MRMPDPLEDPVEVASRRAALLGPPMRPLALFAADIRRQTGRPVPDADPSDGGIEARVLMLLERPPPAVRRVGFVSRDNATPTARNIRRFSGEAGLSRRSTLIWNAVPWMDTDPSAARLPLRADAVRAGLLWLPPLLVLLARLEVVVLAGRVAALAADTLRSSRPRLPLLMMPHPSPTIVCTSPRIGRDILTALGTAAAMVRD